MTLEQLRRIGEEHHKDMVEMGWSDQTKSDKHYLMLVIGELCEAIQAHRKGCVFTSSIVPSDYVSTYADDLHVTDVLFTHTFEYYCKDTVMDEFADILLRLLSLAWMRGCTEPILVDHGYVFGESFTENALRLVDILREDKDFGQVLWSSIFYVIAWSQVLGIDIFKACTRKMRYNRLRTDWRNNEKYY